MKWQSIYFKLCKKNIGVHVDRFIKLNAARNMNWIKNMDLKVHDLKYHSHIETKLNYN